MMEEIIDYIKRAFVNPDTFDLNYTHLRGDQLEPESFYSAVETVPFFSDKRVIIIDDLQSLIQNIDINDTILKTLDNLPEETVVILHDSTGELRKNTKLYRHFKNNNRLVEFNKLNPRDLREYIMRQVVLQGKSMSSQDLSYFVLQTGYENRNLEVFLHQVKSELDKLLAASNEKEITKAQIDDTLTPLNDANIFNLLDSIQHKRPMDALDYLHDLYEKDEPLPVVLHMLKRRYRHLYTYKGLQEEGYPAPEIQKTIKVSNYEFRVLTQQVRSNTICQIKAGIDELYNTEVLMRSVPVDDLILIEKLVIKLAS